MQMEANQVSDNSKKLAVLLSQASNLKIMNISVYTSGFNTLSNIRLENDSPEVIRAYRNTNSKWGRLRKMFCIRNNHFQVVYSRKFDFSDEKVILCSAHLSHMESIHETMKDMLFTLTMFGAVVDDEN